MNVNVKLKIITFQREDTGQAVLFLVAIYLVKVDFFLLNNNQNGLLFFYMQQTIKHRICEMFSVGNHSFLTAVQLIVVIKLVMLNNAIVRGVVPSSIQTNQLEKFPTCTNMSLHTYVCSYSLLLNLAPCQVTCQ